MILCKVAAACTCVSASAAFLLSYFSLLSALENSSGLDRVVYWYGSDRYVIQWNSMDYKVIHDGLVCALAGDIFTPDKLKAD